VLQRCCGNVAGELRNSLPEMVVDILQEKQAQKLSLLSEADAAIDSCLAALAGGCQTSSSVSDTMANPRTDDGLYECPKNWEQMDDSEVSSMIYVCNAS